MQPIRFIGHKGYVLLKQHPLFSRIRKRMQSSVDKLIPNQCLLCSVHSETLICSICETELSSFKLTHQGANLSLRPDVAKALPKLQVYKLLAIGSHKWPLDYLISTLKYRDKPCYASAAAQLFYKNCIQHRTPETLPQCIVATPIHFIKLWLRGFNQSARTAKFLSDISEIPVLEGAVKKRKFTRPQVTKSATARRTLKPDLFSVSESLKELRHIAVFDDVITTGATVSALCRAISKINPNIRIEVWSLSISLPHQ